MARFFVRKLHANVWVGQASLVLPSGKIANNTNVDLSEVRHRLLRVKGLRNQLEDLAGPKPGTISL
ncbi:MAG: hypothetical protein HYW52_09765 [Gemmatimonadetes bacterium]|nr:hypothetical protein [Gemmatimonadota bacterium]